MCGYGCGHIFYCIIFPVYSKMENTGNIVVGLGLGVGVGVGVCMGMGVGEGVGVGVIDGTGALLPLPK